MFKWMNVEFSSYIELRREPYLGVYAMLFSFSVIIGWLLCLFRNDESTDLTLILTAIGSIGGFGAFIIAFSAYRLAKREFKVQKILESCSAINLALKVKLKRDIHKYTSTFELTTSNLDQVDTAEKLINAENYIEKYEKIFIETKIEIESHLLTIEFYSSEYKKVINKDLSEALDLIHNIIGLCGDLTYLFENIKHPNSRLKQFTDGRINFPTHLLLENDFYSKSSNEGKLLKIEKEAVSILEAINIDYQKIKSSKI